MEAKGSVESQSQDRKRENSNAFRSLGEHVKREISVSMNVRLTMMEASRPEILQRYDEAVKRFNESRAQAKAKAAPRGGVGVTASMIVLDPEESGGSVVTDAVRAPDSDQYHAMVHSGTNAIIVPLHPEMKGEIAECQECDCLRTHSPGL